MKYFMTALRWFGGIFIVAGSASGMTRGGMDPTAAAVGVAAVVAFLAAMVELREDDGS